MLEIVALKRGREEEGEMLNWKICVAAGTWDGEALVKSKHAETLHQVIFNQPGLVIQIEIMQKNRAVNLALSKVPNPPSIPPGGWKCQTEGCTLDSNLWLNLTDGAILCGRFGDFFVYRLFRVFNAPCSMQTVL